MSSDDLLSQVEALRTAATGLVQVDLTALSDAALVEAVKVLRPVVCQVQAAETRLVGAVHTRGAAAAEGAVSTVAWLRNRLHDGGATTKVRSSVVRLDFRPPPSQVTHPEVLVEIAVFGRNITDEDNVLGFVDFSNNTGFVNEPRIWGLELGYEFGD